MTIPARGASATSTRSAAIHTVAVGKATDKFDPISLDAEIGDMVVFEFYPANHSVVRAAYSYPCVPYDDVTGETGFFSGYFPVNEILQDPPTWTITINSSDPIFYYCSSSGACIDHGMVGVINPSINESIETQKALAYAADYMLEPGQPFPAEASSSIAQIATSLTSKATVTPSATTTSQSQDVSSSRSPSSGALAGLILGAIAGCLLLCSLIYITCIHWRHKKRDILTSVLPSEGSGMFNSPPQYSTGVASPLSPHSLTFPNHPSIYQASYFHDVQPCEIDSTLEERTPIPQELATTTYQKFA